MSLGAAAAASPGQKPEAKREVPSRAAESRREFTLGLLRRKEQPTPEMLRAAGFGNMAELAQAVADLMRLPRLELDGIDINPDLSKVVGRTLAEKHRIVPLFGSEDEVTVATCDPTRIEIFDWLARELKRPVMTVVATGVEIDRAIQRLYDAATAASEGPEETKLEQPSAAELLEATALVDRMLTRALELRASDIHVEPTDKESTVRLRIDGALRRVEGHPRESHLAVVSRIKVLAQLDISERAAPQDGRIKVRRARGDVDLRVSVLPTFYGEKVCMRVLDNTRAALPLTDLGFPKEQLDAFSRMIRAPYGLVLVTGPTGSGKSTTLYGALNAVRNPELNIVTVEDPVEYQLPGINQVQVNVKRGLTFAAALRSILRQDPNVILVGEIRDRETGTIAAEAALTGHLVLASLHTNDAASAVVRLTEMGIEPHLIAPSMLGVVAQRLLRKVCSGCGEAVDAQPEDAELLGLPPLPEGTRFFRGPGCEQCQGTGFKGRFAVREVLQIDTGLRLAIGRGAPADEIATEAAERGFRGMRFEALKALFAGQTTVSEVVRLTRA